MPSNKMKRFTPAAQRVLALAQEAAERFQHTTIGTEHLLLALATEDEGFAAQALRSFEIEPVRLMQSVKQRTDGKLVPDSPPALAPDVKQTLEFAVDEAHQMGYDHVGTEHLLLALLRQSDCPAMELIKSFVIDISTVREQLSRIVKHKAVITKPPAVYSRLLSIGSKPATFQSKGIENLLLKILWMVEENKLTSEQGIELLGDFFPPYIFPNSARMENICEFKSGGDLKQGEARIKIYDEKTIGENTGRVMTIEQFLNNVSSGLILQSALRPQTIIFEFSDGNITFQAVYHLAEDVP